MIERKNHLDTLAISIVLACCLFWGFQQILIKVTFSEIPPRWQASNTKASSAWPRSCRVCAEGNSWKVDKI